MALITSYSTLLTAVEDYLARSNLTSYVPGFVQNWEESFYRHPENFGRWMEASLSQQISSSVIPVPEAYLGMKYAYVNGNPSSRLDRVSLNQLYGTYPRGGDTGTPVWFARDTTNFVFGPEPDSAYTIKGVYWAKPTLLRFFVSDASGHWLIMNAPEIPLYGALLEAAPFIRNDARIAVWERFYARALDAYRKLHKEEDESGSPPQEVLG